LQRRQFDPEGASGPSEAAEFTCEDREQLQRSAIEVAPEPAAPEADAEERLGTHGALLGGEVAMSAQEPIECPLSGQAGEDLGQRGFEDGAEACQRVPGDGGEAAF
jgi:hypothetical protein